jgi:ABC-type glutathione transport system ATPase component
MMLCQLRNVKKYFPLKSTVLGAPAQMIKAVDGFNLSLAEGETLSIVGESGSGKTTLGRLIADLYKADDGEVLYKGVDIRGMDKAQYREFRRSVQIVFQDPYSSLDPRFTVRRLMRESFTLEKHLSPGKQEERIKEVLTAVELPDDILMRYPHEFSGGERQRLAIARALLCRPKLVILDEAVSSLDVLVQRQILKLLASLKVRFGLTYLFISHNLRVVTKISDKIAVMYQGRVVETGPALELINRPLHPYTRELLMAAVEYRSRHESRGWVLPADGRGQVHGQGHWVMDIV